MLFGDADIEGALGERFREDIDAGARRHRRGDGDDAVVLGRFLDQALAEDLRVGRRIGLGLGLRAGGDVEFHDAMILVAGGFRRGVTLALLGHDMNQDRAVLGVAHVLQDRQKVFEIVAVDRPDIVEAELVEQRAAGEEAAREFLDLRRLVLDEFRQVPGKLLADLAQRQIGAPRDQAREIGRHRPDRRSDRHIVVVENDDQARVPRAGIVHRLIGHAGRHRAVADHGDDIVRLPVQIARDSHAERGGNRRRGMGGAKGVVLAFRALGKTRQPAALTQGANAVAPPGQNLVRIGLVPDIPDEPVARRVEHVMQCNRKFDHAQPRPEMTSGYGDGADRFGAQFIGDLPEVSRRMAS